MIPPRSDPAQPSRIVAQIGIGSGPGQRETRERADDESGQQQREDQDEQRQSANRSGYVIAQYACPQPPRPQRSCPGTVPGHGDARITAYADLAGDCPRTWAVRTCSAEAVPRPVR